MSLQLSGESFCLSKGSSCFPESLIIEIFIIQRVKARAIPCPYQLPTWSDNTVSVAQYGTSTPGATKQLLPPDRVYYYHHYHYLLPESFSHHHYLMVFHWSLSDRKSPQGSRTLRSILTVLNNVVVWMVSTRPPTSKSSSPFSNPLVTVPNVPITIGIIVTSMFQFFFNSLAKVAVLILLFTFF